MAGVAGLVAVVGDGRAGEVEGAAVGGGYYFYGVGVGDVFGGAGDFEGGDVDAGQGERAEEVVDVRGVEEGFVALDVDVDVGGDGLGDSVEAVGAAGEVGAGEDGGPVAVVAEAHDFFGVGGDDDLVEGGAGEGGLVDPVQEWLAGEREEDFAGQARGGKAGGDDAEDAAEGGVMRHSDESFAVWILGWDGRAYPRG